MKNNYHPGEKHASRFVFWAIGISLFLPIIILPPYFQPSDWSRSILFKIILTAITIFLLFKFFYKKDLRIEIPKWDNVTYLPLLALTAYFVIVSVATLFSQDVSFSIFGSPGRAGGTLNLIFFFLFAVLAAFFIGKTQWQKLFHILFVTGVLASALAIVQYFNLIKNVFLSFEGGSAPSFLGNSTVLATFMLFLSFLAFVFFIQQPTKKAKTAYGGLFLLFIFTIFITGSRAAYLAILAGFLYFFLFYPYRQKYQRLKIATVSLIATAILVIALFNLFPQLARTNNIFNTIATRVSVTRIAKDIFGTRLSAWKMTWQAVQEKPLLGWGSENFYMGFEKYYDPKPFATPKLLWDRPHNILLDVAIHSGIFSVLLYLLFWIILFWKLHQLKHNKLADQQDNNTVLKAHGVQTMFIGYLIILLFNFDSFATYLISFLFIGYSLYLIWLPTEKRQLTPPQSVPLKKTVTFATLVVALLFLWFWNIKPMYLNEKIVHAKNLTAQNHCKQSLTLTNNTAWERSGIIKSYVILLYSDIVKNCAFIEPEKEVAYSQKMVSLLTEAAKIQPAFSRTWLYLGSFTNVLAARQEDTEKQKALLDQALAYLQKANELSPSRQEILAEIEKNYLIAEDYVTMEEIGKQCLMLDPRFGECYWHLGIGQIFLGNQQEGTKNIELALQNGYVIPPWKQLAIAYISQKNWKAALAAYEKIPINYDEASIDTAASHHATLAYLYKQSGSYARAGEEALKVFRLQPENPETVQFIKLLLAQSPSNPIINSSLAFIYAQPGPQQETAKAIAIYEQLIANYPENADYRWRLIETYYAKKDYNRAYAQIVAMLKVLPIQKQGAENFIKRMPPIHWEHYINRFGF